jgi:archaellum component FlaC
MEQIIGVVCLVIGAIIAAFSKQLFKFLKELFEGKSQVTPFVTHEQLDKKASKIYDDFACELKAAKSEMATKESVRDLKEDVNEVKKKVDDISATVTSIDKNLAVLTSVVERRKESKE